MPLKNKSLTAVSNFLKGNFFRKLFSWFYSHKYWNGVVLILILLYYFSLPKNLFPESTSTILEDRNGLLLGAKITADGQWRFPKTKEIPYKFKRSILNFEDKRFYTHPGFNPLSIGRAILQNIKAGHIVSGGSTITMQVIRLSRKDEKRNIVEKIIEIILSTRLELRLKKEEILNLYCSYAPFGGNVVGLEAASWRYFGRSPSELSWAESATMAVLPNSPSLIRPGKNRELLTAKRNRVLDILFKNKDIDSITWQLSRLESIPDRPYMLPSLCPHLLEKAHKMYRGMRIRTSIDFKIQNQVNHILLSAHKILKGNQIQNAAALVIDVKSNRVLAYAGNVISEDSTINESDVDCIQAQRSTGSVIKPFLFASMLDDGEILSTTLIPDVPSQFGGFFPKNFDEGYDGAVPASRALARSLNVPAVRLLQQHGIEKFHFLLQSLGLKGIKYPADHYGLSIILGGGESTLWEITNVYASLSRVLNHFYEFNGMYRKDDFNVSEWRLNSTLPPQLSPQPVLLSAASIWLTYEALIEVNRPEIDHSWISFSSKYKIAWKTGTSYGNRDAWAIGTTPEYAVGVWVGNADGEGRPLLYGISCAAPVLFDIYNILSPSDWFRTPYDELVKIPVCSMSGYRAGPNCEKVDSIWIEKSGLNTRPCPYHLIVHLSPDGRFRVNSKCEDPSKMIHKSWFVLTPVMERYYKARNPSYKILPPYKAECISEGGARSMEMIYPRSGSRIYIPKEITGNKGKLVMEAVHRNLSATIFWHLDDIYLGSTKQFHQMAVDIPAGTHFLNVIDDVGESITVEFEILEK
jgi:penicillin-binding protein 1C